MPRQRMIKPEFFDSESLALCSIEARLAFIGLWVMGDDYGNQKAQLFRLQHRIFPYDRMENDKFFDILCELEDVGCIKGYEVDDERYINIPNFTSYQTVKKPSATNIPAPPESVVESKTTRAIHEWRTGWPLSNNQLGSTELVDHHGTTSSPKRKKERKKEVVVLQQQLPKASTSGGAVAEESAPPSAPDCPLCGVPLRKTGMADEPWWCDNCTTGFKADKVVA